jgi:hypothetical protein
MPKSFKKQPDLSGGPLTARDRRGSIRGRKQKSERQQASDPCGRGDQMHEIGREMNAAREPRAANAVSGPSPVAQHVARHCAQEFGDGQPTPRESIASRHSCRFRRDVR